MDTLIDRLDRAGARYLLATKLATHRAQDQQDIAFLKELLARV